MEKSDLDWFALIWFFVIYMIYFCGWFSLGIFTWYLIQNELKKTMV